jgi:hypothetical protein
MNPLKGKPSKHQISIQNFITQMWGLSIRTLTLGLFLIHNRSIMDNMNLILVT